MVKRGMSKEEIYAKLDKTLKTQEGKLNYLNSLARHIGKTDPLTQQSFFEVTAEVSEEIGSKGKKPELLIESANAYERLGQKDKVNQIRLKAAELFVEKAETERNLFDIDRATELFDKLGEKDKKRESIYKKGKIMMEQARVNPYLNKNQRMPDYIETGLFRQAADLFKSIGVHDEEQKAAISYIKSSMSQSDGEQYLSGSGDHIISFLKSHGVKDNDIGDVVEKGGWNVFERWDRSMYTGGHGWNPHFLRDASAILRKLGLTERANELGSTASRLFLERGVIDSALNGFIEAGDKEGTREAAIAMLGSWDLKVNYSESSIKNFMDKFELKKEDVINVAQRLMQSACSGKANGPYDSTNGPYGSYACLAENRLKAVLNEDEVNNVLGELYEKMGENFAAIDRLSKSPKSKPHAIELARKYATREIKREGQTGYRNAISVLERVGLDKDGTPEDIELLADAYEKSGIKDGPRKAIALRRKLAR